MMKLKLNRSIFFVNSSPEAIVHLVQKALFTCKLKRKITAALHNKIRPE